MLRSDIRQFPFTASVQKAREIGDLAERMSKRRGVLKGGTIAVVIKAYSYVVNDRRKVSSSLYVETCLHDSG